MSRTAVNADMLRGLVGEAMLARLAASLQVEDGGATAAGAKDPHSPEESASRRLEEIASVLVDPGLLRACAAEGISPAEAPSPGEASSPGEERPMRVLVVDDDPDVRVTLGAMLSREQCEVGEACDAAEARRLAVEGWDMAAVDLVLPDGNGLALLADLRQASPGLEGIVVTGHSSLETAVEAMRQGATDYLVKPFTRPEVTRVVHGARGRRRLLGEREALLLRLERTVFELELLQSIRQVAATTLDPRDLVAMLAEALPQVLAPDLLRCWASGPDGVVGWEVGRTAAGRPLVPWVRGLEARILGLLGGDVPEAEEPAGDGSEAPAAGSWVAVPVLDGERTAGLLVLASAREGAFSCDNAQLLYRAGTELSLTLERARELVANEKRRMESVVAGMGEGVVVTDARGVPIVVNPAARLLLSLPAQGDPARLLRTSEPGRALATHLGAALGFREEPGPRELVFEGTPPRRVSLQIGLAQGRRGELRGAVALLEDVTVRREADLLQSEFVSAVSHELRTPLSCVRNYVDMVLDGRAGSLTPTQERFLATARRNVDRLTDLIDNLLSLSRSEDVRTDASLEGVDLGAMVTSVLEGLRAEAAERNVELALELPPDGLEVRGDRERLGQAVHLLLRQAVKVSGRDSCVEVAGGRVSSRAVKGPPEEAALLSAHRRWVRLTVRLGRAEVTPAEARDLFRRFRPSRGTGAGEARALAASGLALALARSLVEAHEGLLWAEPRPGAALEFEMLLPLQGPSPRQGELLERVRALLDRSRREGVQASLVVLRLGGRGHGTAAGRGEADGDAHTAIRAVAGTVRCGLRNEDRLFADPQQRELALFLEHTDGRGVAVVVRRLTERLRALGESAPGPLAGFGLEIGWATFPHEGVTAQEVVALARRRCVSIATPIPAAS